MIRFENVSFSYNSNEQILDNVNFTIKNHEWVSILGHNGSGKSTLAKLMIGLNLLGENTKGQIVYDFDGEDIILSEENLNKIRKRVGIVFQNPDNQFVGYNVKYDIAFGLENHQVPREEMLKLIDEYATKVGMKDELEREPQTLSGGQKQRVAIAGILALDCDLIILDESTSMLDPEGTKEIIDLIVELKEKYHKTIITITHDLALANKSDRIIVLKDGKILKDDVPSKVFAERSLLQSSNLDMPFSLRFYHEAKGNKLLEKDEKLMEALWEYHLKK